MFRIKVREGTNIFLLVFNYNNMKKYTIGVFAHRSDAEKAINFIHNKLSVPKDQISYVYKNTDDEIKEVDADDVASNTPLEGAKKGAGTGAIIGAIAGIAATVGMIPIIGPLIAAGPLVTALGITGAVGAAASGAVGGVAIGGIIGALVNLGVGKEKAQQYQDRVMAGDILVTVLSDMESDVEEVLTDNGATDVESFKPTV